MFQKQDWPSGDEVNLEKVPFLDSLSLSGHHILKADHQRIAEIRTKALLKWPKNWT